MKLEKFKYAVVVPGGGTHSYIEKIDYETDSSFGIRGTRPTIEELKKLCERNEKKKKRNNRKRKNN